MEKPIKPRPAILLTSGLAGAIAVALLYFFAPSEHAFYPRCLFFSLTGFSCSGCGSLRALHALLHGHFADALHLNAMLVVSLPLLAWMTLRFRSGNLKTLLKNRALQICAWSYAALWIAFGIARNLPGSMFAALKF